MPKNTQPVTHMTTDAWLEMLQQQGKSLHTVAAYRRGLAHFGRWYVGTYGASFQPDEVMPRVVRDWKAYQQTAEQAAPASISQPLVAERQ